MRWRLQHPLRARAAGPPRQGRSAPARVSGAAALIRNGCRAAAGTGASGRTGPPGRRYHLRAVDRVSLRRGIESRSGRGRGHRGGAGHRDAQNAHNAAIQPRSPGPAAPGEQVGQYLPDGAGTAGPTPAPPSRREVGHGWSCRLRRYGFFGQHGLPLRTDASCPPDEPGRVTRADQVVDARLHRAVDTELTAVSAAHGVHLQWSDGQCGRGAAPAEACGASQYPTARPL